MRPLYGELMEVTWHPSRVFAWCFEECVKKFINAPIEELRNFIEA